MTREKIFRTLLSFADAAADVAFSRKNRWWRRCFVAISNGLDRLAGQAMTEEMRQRPAIAAPNAELAGPRDAAR